MGKIEEVARAIDPQAFDPKFCHVEGCPDCEDGRERARQRARAAIEAMREPSDGQAAVMRELLEKSERPPTKRWHWIWQEMISAALEEAEGGEG